MIPGLRLRGQIEEQLSLSQSDLEQFATDEKVDDIRSLGAKRAGSGVYLKALLNRARIKPSARFITFHSPSDDFMASVPLERVIDDGVVVYSIEGRPMTSANGGPFRFIIPDPALCGGDELDECVNVKHLEEIIVSAERGRDTRPQDDKEHAKLHGHEK